MLNSVSTNSDQDHYKTAYPYYSDKKKLANELILQDYQLTKEDVSDIRKRMPNHDSSQLCYATLLIVFKNLNYFSPVDLIPKDIITYVKEQLQLPTLIELNTIKASNLTRYKKNILAYYNVTPWNFSKIISGKKDFNSMDPLTFI